MQYKYSIFQAVDAKVRPEIQLQPNNGITTPNLGRGLFSPGECDRILQLTQTVEGRQAVTGDGKGAIATSRRKSTVWEMYPGAGTDWVFNRLERAMMQLNSQYSFGITGFFEGAQIYRYPLGGHLDWHMDIGQDYMSTRKLSMTVQLSDADSYAGGNLEFMDFNSHAPRGRGDLIVFPAFLMHRITPVTSGERYCWVSWVHGPPFR